MGLRAFPDVHDSCRCRMACTDAPGGQGFGGAIPVSRHNPRAVKQSSCVPASANPCTHAAVSKIEASTRACRSLLPADAPNQRRQRTPCSTAQSGPARTHISLLRRLCWEPAGRHACHSREVKSSSVQAGTQGSSSKVVHIKLGGRCCRGRAFLVRPGRQTQWLLLARLRLLRLCGHQQRRLRRVLHVVRVAAARQPVRCRCEERAERLMRGRPQWGCGAAPAAPAMPMPAAAAAAPALGPQPANPPVRMACGQVGAGHTRVPQRSVAVGVQGLERVMQQGETLEQQQATSDCFGCLQRAAAPCLEWPPATTPAPPAHPPTSPSSCSITEGPCGSGLRGRAARRGGGPPPSTAQWGRVRQASRAAAAAGARQGAAGGAAWLLA